MAHPDPQVNQPPIPPPPALHRVTDTPLLQTIVSVKEFTFLLAQTMTLMDNLTEECCKLNTYTDSVIQDNDMSNEPRILQHQEKVAEYLVENMGIEDMDPVYIPVFENYEDERDLYDDQRNKLLSDYCLQVLKQKLTEDDYKAYVDMCGPSTRIHCGEF